MTDKINHNQLKLNEFALQFFRSTELVAAIRKVWENQCSPEFEEIMEGTRKIPMKSGILYIIQCTIVWAKFLAGEEVVFTVENLKAASNFWQQIGPTQLKQLDFHNCLVVNLTILDEANPPYTAIFSVGNPAPIPPGEGITIKNYKVKYHAFSFHTETECYICGRVTNGFSTSRCKKCTTILWCVYCASYGRNEDEHEPLCKQIQILMGKKCD